MPVDSRRRKLKPTDIPSISADPYLTAGDVFKKNIEFLTGLKD
ncbi:hypothetical protein FACS1894166_12530 [Bacilli bacterium]|nr:hypothetical protein FACS1894166_12530 [Bacilli bacterium]